MPLPLLTDHAETRDALQKAAQPLSQMRKALIGAQPNALHLALFPTPYGLSTGLTPIGEFRLDFAPEPAYRFFPADGSSPSQRFISGRAPVELVGLLLEALRERPVDDTVNLMLPLEKDDTPLKINAVKAAEIAQVLYACHSVLARVRSRLMGTQMPLVLWPHHFDLSTLWFPGTDPDEHAQPHLNMGFALESPGFERPYFYAYAWPLPEGLLDQPLPAPARWSTEGFTGAVLDYDAIATASAPEERAEDLLHQVHAVMRAAML